MQKNEIYFILCDERDPHRFPYCLRLVIRYKSILLSYIARGSHQDCLRTKSPFCIHSIYPTGSFVPCDYPVILITGVFPSMDTDSFAVIPDTDFPSIRKCKSFSARLVFFF